MGASFEAGHLKGVEENGREDERRERVQKGKTFSGPDDRVSRGGGRKNYSEIQEAEK